MCVFVHITPFCVLFMRFSCCICICNSRVLPTIFNFKEITCACYVNRQFIGTFKIFSIYIYIYCCVCVHWVVLIYARSKYIAAL